MHFIVRLLLAPDFKRMVNWLSLKGDDVTLGEKQFSQAPSLCNFVILTALKIQQLMGDLKEAQDLSQTLQVRHRQWKEKELEAEIQVATLKAHHQREL